MNIWTGTDQPTNHHHNAILSGAVFGAIAAKNHYDETGDPQHAARMFVRAGVIGYCGYLLLVMHALVSFCLPFVILLWAQGPIWEAYDANSDAYSDNNIAITGGMRAQQILMLLLAGAHVIATIYAMWRWGLAAILRAWDEFTARPYQEWPRPDWKFEARCRPEATFYLLTKTIAVPWLVALGGGFVVCILLGELGLAFSVLTCAGLLWFTYAISRALYGAYFPDFYVPWEVPTRGPRPKKERGPNAAPLWMMRTLKWGGGAAAAWCLGRFALIILTAFINPYPT